MTSFEHQPLFQLGQDTTEYRLLTTDGISTAEFEGNTILKVSSAVLKDLAAVAMRDVAHLLRHDHLTQLASILDDPESSNNDRFVATELLKNANVAAGMVLPSCQDTGTAIVHGYKGQQIWTEGDDEAALSEGIFTTYTETNLRYSQMAPLSMYEEKNTGTNLPAQIEIHSEPGDEYHFMFVAKGGGSANKTYLYQETRALLSPKKLLSFLDEKVRTLGTAACPPYHLAIVIGGFSAEHNLTTVKKASTHALDSLPTTGNEYGRAFRDTELEAQIFKLTQDTGIGAQFGGKYFCHDV
ncbi:MAG: fumarate hydratase, partial [Acidimicrobiales bacterium]